MVIGVDIDDVLADLASCLVKFHNEHFGTFLTKEDHSNYDLSKIWGCSKSESMERMMKFFESEQFENVLPLSGAFEGVKALKEMGNRLFIITSRPHALKEKTIKWINTHFEGYFDEIYFTGHPATQGAIKKANLCKELGVEIMLEDCLEVAFECLEKNISVILFDSPWNRCVNLPEGIIRVSSWSEILRALPEIIEAKELFTSKRSGVK
jgi:uncharacterized HAD superfamily protein